MPPVLGKEIYEINIVFDFKYMFLLSSLFLTEKGLYFLNGLTVFRFPKQNEKGGEDSGF